jgi:hypothetical protein
MIIGSNISPLIIGRKLHVVRTQNASVLGSLFVSNCLDGTIRRRSFRDLLTPEKVFSAIPMLSFRSPAFVSADLVRLVFCAVVAAIHLVQEVFNNARPFLESALDTPEHATVDFAKHRSRITKLSKNVKHASPLDVFERAERLSGSVRECVRKGFADLVLTQAPCESTQM